MDDVQWKGREGNSQGEGMKVGVVSSPLDEE
jgi:hypothetical protein